MYRFCWYGLKPGSGAPNRSKVLSTVINMVAFVSSNYKYWLDEAAKRAELMLSSTQVRQILLYIELLLAKNKVMDLTNITEPEELGIKHLLDSWMLLPEVDRISHLRDKEKTWTDQLVTLVDVGSGAGFPGMVLKLVRPELEVLLLDAQRKRIDFLQECIEKLELSGIVAKQMRAEVAGRRPEFRDKFDLATARAVAALPQLVELCLPLVKPGGVFLAMKGQDNEANSARQAIAQLSGRLNKVWEYLLPATDMRRSLVVIEKIAPTDKIYPRSFARIKNKPLR